MSRTHLLAVGLGVVALVLLIPGPARAADRYVEAGAPYDPFNDCSSPVQPCGSIVNATINAASGDVIQVGPGTYNEVVVAQKDLTIEGAGADQSTLQAGGQAVALQVSDGADVTVQGMTITGGTPGQDQQGGGLDVGEASTVTLVRCHVTENDGQQGGGIHSRGELIIRRSTLSDNSASGARPSGSGLYADGGTVTVTNSTVTGNRASSGSGIAVAGGGSATLRAVTLLQNEGPELRVLDGRVTLGSTLVADDDGRVCSAEAGGMLGSAGYNLTVDGGGCPTDGAGDRSVAPSILFSRVVEAEPAADGNSTPTHVLHFEEGATNPALDAGTTVGTTDQRGEPRAVDAPGRPNRGGDAADVGAVELTAETLPVELASFTAVADRGVIRLQWTTASEAHNAGFRIERKGERGEGRKGAWVEVGLVDGAGTTDEPQTYRFEDTDLPYEADLLTYRLEQVDTDGSTSYSNPIIVERSAVMELQLLGTYPNPVRSRTTVRFAIPEGADAKEIRLRLYDVMGRRMRTVEATAKAGRHELQLETGRLSSGMYVLRLQAGAAVKTQKLTVVQ